MRRLFLTFAAIAALTWIGGCNKKSPAEPTPNPTPPTPTRIITLTGDLTFGGVNIGTSTQRQFSIRNDGNSALTFTGMTGQGGTGAAGFAATPLTGSVPAGGAVVVTVAFTPTLAQNYNTLLTVASDQTNVGYHQIGMSGTGINPNPIFTMSGKGNSVFNLPSYVARVRVTGHFVDQGGNSNFIVQRNGLLMINEILRTADYDGTHLTTGGGTIEITNSSSIQWTFTELR